MVRYVIRLFAGLSEALSCDSVTIDVEGRVTAAQLKIQLRQQYPSVSSQIERALVAVNRQYAPPDTILTSTDEIALIPPVGGGAPNLKESSCLIAETALCVQEAYSLLESSLMGGIVLFCGTVREWTNGRQTSHLDYKAYRDMALQHMRNLEAEVTALYPGVHTLQWHRVGRLKPTDIAVICGAASPHRDEAFKAARTLIDRLKAEVPIWKKEFFADGTAEWRDNGR